MFSYREHIVKLMLTHMLLLISIGDYGNVCA